MNGSAGGQIDSVMQEARVFPPPPEFAARARIGSMEEYEALYERAKNDPESFWGDYAREELHWFEPFTRVLEWNEPYARWFVGGKTNISYNCLDRHLQSPRRHKLESALYTRSSSPASPPKRLPNGITTPKRNCRSRLTADGGAARSCR